jgi:hypothetical protein
VCAQRFCKECRCQNPLKIREGEAQEGQRSHTRSETPSRGVRRQKGSTKVEAFGNGKFFQAQEGSTQKSQKSSAAVRSA